MKSYLQGFITGGVFVLVLIGALISNIFNWDS